MRIESIDDDEMREFDIEEHREILAAGIPEHLGIYNPAFFSVRALQCLCQLSSSSGLFCHDESLVGSPN